MLTQHKTCVLHRSSPSSEKLQGRRETGERSATHTNSSRQSGANCKFLQMPLAQPQTHNTTFPDSPAPQCVTTECLPCSPEKSSHSHQETLLESNTGEAKLDPRASAFTHSKSRCLCRSGPPQLTAVPAHIIKCLLCGRHC